MKKVFEEKRVDPQILFSLSPIRQVEFALYQDLKYSLAGMITDESFARMTKSYFLAILAYRMAKIFAKNPSVQMVRINQSDLASEDRHRVASYINDSWLQHLGVKDKSFFYREIRPETQQQAQRSGDSNAGKTFLEQINEGSSSSGQGPIRLQQNRQTTPPSTYQGGSGLHSFKRDDDGTRK